MKKQGFIIIELMIGMVGLVTIITVWHIFIGHISVQKRHLMNVIEASNIARCVREHIMIKQPLNFTNIKNFTIKIAANSGEKGLSNIPFFQSYQIQVMWDKGKDKGSVVSYAALLDFHEN